PDHGRTKHRGPLQGCLHVFTSFACGVVTAGHLPAEESGGGAPPALRSRRSAEEPGSSSASVAHVGRRMLPVLPLASADENVGGQRRRALSHWRPPAEASRE